MGNPTSAEATYPLMVSVFAVAALREEYIETNPVGSQTD
jgi:hypothetical protein